MPVVGDIGSRLRRGLCASARRKSARPSGSRWGWSPASTATTRVVRSGSAASPARKPATGPLKGGSSAPGAPRRRERARPVPGANDNDLGSAARGQDAIEHRRPGEGARIFSPPMRCARPPQGRSPRGQDSSYWLGSWRHGRPVNAQLTKSPALGMPQRPAPVLHGAGRSSEALAGRHMRHSLPRARSRVEVGEQPVHRASPGTLR